MSTCNSLFSFARDPDAPMHVVMSTHLGADAVQFVISFSATVIAFYPHLYVLFIACCYCRHYLRRVAASSLVTNVGI